MSWESARFGFAKTHATASGHFPDNPMIPGALLLDAVIAEIAGPQSEAAMLIRSTKFLRIVRPAEALDLRWQRLGDGSVKFECRVGDALALTGVLALQAAS
jgi:3-hydroxymyristoyl/3-hydroxydecanoyl-(acyl carrier protein) dehydratase